eukprot:2791633-Pyramimonas_sp.AAC.1
MFAWKLKCSLSGDRWDFQVNMGHLRACLLPQRTTRRRARARARASARCSVHNRKVAMLAWNRRAPLAVTDGISKFTWGFYVPVYCRSVQRADARAR